ncbi:MAG: hypothetical protein RSB77_03005 [Bacilli bacterium]
MGLVNFILSNKEIVCILALSLLVTFSVFQVYIIIDKKNQKIKLLESLLEVSHDTERIQDKLLKDNYEYTDQIKLAVEQMKQKIEEDYAREAKENLEKIERKKKNKQKSTSK